MFFVIASTDRDTLICSSKVLCTVACRAQISSSNCGFIVDLLCSVAQSVTSQSSTIAAGVSINLKNAGRFNCANVRETIGLFTDCVEM
jgi:hypothetical protein